MNPKTAFTNLSELELDRATFAATLALAMLEDGVLAMVEKLDYKGLEPTPPSWWLHPIRRFRDDRTRAKLSEHMGRLIDLYDAIAGERRDQEQKWRNRP